jgi:hypothetical protein
MKKGKIGDKMKICEQNGQNEKFVKRKLKIWGKMKRKDVCEKLNRGKICEQNENL